MRNLFLVTLLYCSSSLAIPSVGDVARWEGKMILFVGRMPMEHNFFEQDEILSFDPAKKVYLVKQETSLNGIETVEISLDSMATDQSINDKLKNCVEAKGHLEKITTKAGTFDTCSIKESDSSGETKTWHALVPFGFAKTQRVTKSGSLNASLVSYKLGSPK